MLDAYKVPSNDVTWVFIGPSTWTAVETNIGIVSGKSTFSNFLSLGVFLRYADADMTYSLSPFSSAHFENSEP